MILQTEVYKTGNDYTISKLSVNGVFFCYIMEDPIMDHKEFGITAIPRGTYNIIITFSDHFQRLLPLLQNVPDYAGVRIHSGNVPSDTAGCLLPGLDIGELGGKVAVTHSREAFEMIFKKMQDAETKGETITIELK